MAGAVDDCDALLVVLEGEDGGSDGDAALLLHFHPVGGDVALGAAGADSARLLDGATVEEEFFCECALAGVRVGDDG